MRVRSSLMAVYLVGRITLTVRIAIVTSGAGSPAPLMCPVRSLRVEDEVGAVQLRTRHSDQCDDAFDNTSGGAYGHHRVGTTCHHRDAGAEVGGRNPERCQVE